MLEITVSDESILLCRNLKRTINKIIKQLGITMQRGKKSVGRRHYTFRGHMRELEILRQELTSMLADPFVFELCYQDHVSISTFQLFLPFS